MIDSGMDTAGVESSSNIEEDEQGESEEYISLDELIGRVNNVLKWSKKTDTFYANDVETYEHTR